MPVPLRIVTTNDLIASFAPQETSYGRLPGARALVEEVERLRAESEGLVWIDTGDFAQGSPLCALSDGAGGFLAARELPIDVSVVGNHELDWGEAHLRRWAGELPFPLLAANADLGFSSTAVLEAAGRRIGVVGLTYPEMPSLHPEIAVAADFAGVAREAAASLREQGADLIVVALHDGPDPRLVDGRPEIDSARVAGFCRAVEDGGVDLVLGGHTLEREVGVLEGVPFLQPWPFGSQLGIAEVGEDGSIGLSTIDPEPSPWNGLGCGLYRKLEEELVATTRHDLVNGIAERSLAELLAEGMLASIEADVAIVIPTDMWNQAPQDGILAFLRAGDVSLAQTLRLAPLTGARSAWGGQMAVAELPRSAALRAIEAILLPNPSETIPAHQPVVAERSMAGERLRIALAPRLRPLVERAAESEVAWHPAAGTWHAALLGALAGGS